MVKYVYSVKYVPSGEYGPPFVATNSGHASRIFRSMLKDVDEQDREDFVLFEIGLFDDQTGEIMANEVIEEVNNEQE